MHLWLTGGPGCSSLVALFAENGPYIIADDLSLSLNPYSWNTNATVIWIDQPVNTGYSYSEPGDWGVFSEAQMAENMYEFLQGFLQQYPKYANLDFFITGESYAGHYIPALATRILAGNADSANPTINLQAIAIGNGLVDPAIQYTQYAPFAAANQVLSPAVLAIMEAAIPGCVAAIGTCAQNSSLGLLGCLSAYETCNVYELLPLQLTGRSLYDVRIKCEVPPLCYNFTNVDLLLSQPVQQCCVGSSRGHCSTDSRSTRSRTTCERPQSPREKVITLLRLTHASMGPRSSTAHPSCRPLTHPSCPCNS